MANKDYEDEDNDTVSADGYFYRGCAVTIGIMIFLVVLIYCLEIMKQYV